jgi:hypothetical protein
VTRNCRHYGPLGVRTIVEGVNGVTAVAAIDIGEILSQAVVVIPEARTGRQPPA